MVAWRGSDEGSNSARIPIVREGLFERATQRRRRAKRTGGLPEERRRTPDRDSLPGVGEVRPAAIGERTDLWWKASGVMREFGVSQKETLFY